MMDYQPRFPLFKAISLITLVRALRLIIESSWCSFSASVDETTIKGIGLVEKMKWELMGCDDSELPFAAGSPFSC